MSTVEQDKPPIETAPAIVCRPDASFWILVLMGLFSGVGLCLTAHSPTKNGQPSAASVLSLQIFGICVVLAALVLGFWLLRARIVADDMGLRWRRFGGWRGAGWGEVQDYYDLQVAGRIIKTTAGSVRFGEDWVAAKSLREAVARQATSAAASEWGLLGTRPCDPWPRVFGYDTFSNRWSPRLLLKLSVAFVVYVLVQPALSLTGLAALVGWRMTLTTAALYLLLTLPLAIMLLVRPLLEYRAVQKRMKEHITLNREGLVFEDGTRRIDASWQDVTGYSIIAGKYVVETGSGAFDFLGSIGSSLILRENIKWYAAQSADTNWKARADAEALGGEAARWSGGQVGVGARVFHYRIRSLRMGLAGVACVCLLGWGLGAATMLGWLPGGNPPPLGVVVGGTVLMAVFLGMGWRIYRWGGVHMDEDGLTQFTLLGQTRLMWVQVSKFYLGTDGVSIVEGRDGRRIRFSSMIVGGEELQAEIVRRAASCGRTEWQKRSPA